VHLRAGGRASASRSVEVDRNYVPLAAVHGGRNRLSFRAEEYDGLHIHALTILPDSGVSVTYTPPTNLSLGVVHRTPTGAKAMNAGETLHLELRVQNVGGCAARDTAVVAAYDPADYAPIGPARITLGSVTTPRIVRFDLRPRRAGMLPLAIAVASNANSPRVATKIPVHARPTRFARFRIPAASSLAVLAAVCWTPAAKRRRRSVTS
jgi:hypothetical protein